MGQSRLFWRPAIPGVYNLESIRMRVHYLQHVPFEDAANIAVWAQQRGHIVTVTRLYEDEPLPDVAGLGLLGPGLVGMRP